MRRLALVLALLSAGSAGAAEAPVSFGEALHKILSRSTTIASERANLQAVQSNVVPSRLFFLPTLTAGAQNVWTNSSSATTVDRQLLGQAQLNLFRFGGDLAAWRAGSADVKREESRLTNTIIQAEDEGVRALVALLLDRSLLDLYRRMAKLREESLAIARERYRRGYLPMQEVSKVEVDYENIRSTLADTELQTSQATAELERLLGLGGLQAEKGAAAATAPDGSAPSLDPAALDLSWPWKDRAWPTEPQAIARLLPEATPLDQRPDWQAAQLRVEAEDQRYTQAQRAILPTLDSYFNLTQSQLNGPSWTGVLAVNIPLFDRFANVSKLRAQLATRASAEVDLEATARTAKSEWDSSRRDFTVTLASAQAREKTVGIARQVYQDNLRRFQAGRVTVNDLTLDLQRLTDAERLQAEGWSSFHLALARVCHAMGKLVSESCPLLPNRQRKP